MLTWRCSRVGAKVGETSILAFFFSKKNWIGRERCSLG
jgi:hypothetical protein